MSVPNLFIENENTLFFEINKPLTLNKCEGIGIKGTGTTIENSSQTGGMDRGIEMAPIRQDGSEQPKKFITGILFKGDGNITININKNLDDSVIDSSLLGSEYKNKEILEILKNSKLRYYKSDNIEAEVANFINLGKV